MLIWINLLIRLDTEMIVVKFFGYRAMGSGFAILIALMMLSAAPAQAAPVPLKAGKYLCHTITTTARTQTADEVLNTQYRDENGIRVRPMTPPQILLAPAAFGAILIDGKGGYTMPAIRQSGRYGFNAARGVPTFTGDLGAMRVAEYRGSGEDFTLEYRGTRFQCSLPAKPSTVMATGTRKPNPAFVSAAGPIRPYAAAADFKGTYVGGYVCSNQNVHLQLELVAKPDGSMTGVFSFGGLHTPEGSYFLGSYALKGSWRGTHYQLTGDHWIKQPAGYTMVNIEGDLTTLGTSGVILLSSCDSYAARKVNR